MSNTEGSQNAGNSKSKINIVIDNDSKLVVTKLGSAAIRGTFCSFLCSSALLPCCCFLVVIIDYLYSIQYCYLLFSVLVFLFIFILLFAEK